MELGKRVRVILVQPKYSGNIGAVARAMKNFGFSDLTLVSPLAKIDGLARMYAVRAQDLLDQVNVVDTIEEAIRDADLVVGTTARGAGSTSNLLRSSYPPREVAGIVNRTASRAAFLFGREDMGLRNEELETCDIVLRVPSSHVYPTLNVSTAVAITLYELYFASRSGHVHRATSEAISRIIYEADLMLGAASYPPFRRKRAARALKNILGRSLPSPREASLLVGIFRKARMRLADPAPCAATREAQRHPCPRGRSSGRP